MFTQTSLPSPQTNCPYSCPPADKMTDGMWRLSDLNKQAKTSWYALKTRPQSVFSSSTVSGGHIGMRGKCVGKVTAAPSVWREQSGKTTNGSSVLFLHFDTSLSPSCCLSSTPSSSVVIVFFPSPLSRSLSCFTQLSLSGVVYLPPPFLFPVLFFTQLHSDVCLPPSLHFFMSFWPWSHFPNWLSGSLIILRHPCCRLFYLPACRRPNPLISKHPSSAHTASQQPTASLLYLSTVHTDGPSTSSRQEQHTVTLRATQVKDLLEYSSGTRMDQRIYEFVQLSTLTPLHQLGGEML